MDSFLEDFNIPQLSRINKTYCIEICKNKGQGLMDENRFAEYERVPLAMNKVQVFQMKIISR